MTRETAVDTGGPPSSPTARTRLRSLSSASTPQSHRRLADAFLMELGLRDPDGSRLNAATSLDQAAVLAVDQVLDPSVIWEETIGAFYGTESVRRLLGGQGGPVSRQAVHKRKGLLALTTGSGQVVYPAMQFRGRTPAPGMDRVLDALPQDLVSRWTVASWLVTPQRELGGHRPIDVLFDTEPAGLDAVVTAARSWAAALAA